MVDFGTQLQQENIEQVRRQYRLPDSYMISVSSIARLKNTQGLLQTCVGLKQKGIHIPLVLVGAVWREDYQQAASNYGLRVGRDVFFLQSISDHDLRALYQGARLFVQLSWRENFGYPMTEAMASGIPVVVSQFAALPEVLGQGGITVDPRNLDRVVATIAHLLESESLQQQFRERARQRSKDFSWQKTAEETVAVYEELRRCA